MAQRQDSNPFGESNEFGFPKKSDHERGDALATTPADSGNARTGAHPGGPQEGAGVEGGGTFGDEGGGGSYGGAHDRKGSVQSGGPGRGMRESEPESRHRKGVL